MELLPEQVHCPLQESIWTDIDDWILCTGRTFVDIDKGYDQVIWRILTPNPGFHHQE